MADKIRTILLSAYACEPLKGSEPGVGWHWVLQMAKSNKLHVITRANNRTPIEEYLPESVAHNITFHYYDTGRFIRKFKDKERGLYFYYFVWQLGIISTIRKLKREYKFDYSMHLTFGSIWLPTFLPFFSIPFIWGPVGGGEGEPHSFMKLLPLKQRLLQYFRIIMNKTAFLNPGIFFSSWKAVAILSRTNNSKSVIPGLFRSKVRVVLETAMESDIFNFSAENNESKNEKTHLIITGRLTPSKNTISAVRSLKYVPVKYNISLTIIGSGIEKNRIEKEIDRLNQQHRVEIISEVTRSEVLDKLSQSDIFIFPSLREGGSWALMEAMAVGLPVICLKWSGMEIITDDQSAIRLSVTNPDQMPKDMAKAICYLIDNPELCRKMGNSGRERIKNEFNWDAKGEFMENLFCELDKNRGK